jgi:ABC-type sugar transport system substrate-binding protein
LGLVLCLAILLGVPAVRAQSVAFINPGKSDEIYWVTATQSMQAAAHSLGMTFEVQYAQREPLKTFEIAREMVARPSG